jgi:hypothetical protein
MSLGFMLYPPGKRCINKHAIEQLLNYTALFMVAASPPRLKSKYFVYLTEPKLGFFKKVSRFLPCFGLKGAPESGNYAGHPGADVDKMKLWFTARCDSPMHGALS